MWRLATVGLMWALVWGTTPTGAQDDQASRAEGLFEPTGNPRHERGHHSAATLPDGRVLVVGLAEVMGGRSWEPVPAELWDPASGTFSETGTPRQNRSRAAAVTLDDGRVLIVGGEVGAGGSDLVRFAELWDPTTGRFTKAGRLREPRYWNDAALLPDGRVVVVGGSGKKGQQSTIELWDPATGKFRKAGKLPQPRFGQTTTVLSDGRVLVVGGYTQTRRGIRWPKEALVWDPASGKVSATGKLLGAGRFNHAAALLPDGRVLVVGGEHFDRGEFASAEVWDPETGAFTETGSMSVPRVVHSATTLPDGRVLIVGGSDEGIPAEIWNPATGSFGLSGPMLESRYGHTANLLPDGRVLVVGWESAELWDPAKTYSPAPPASLALGACAASDDPEATALTSLLPSTLQGVSVEVTACRGADWLAMHDASDPASAATIERASELLESVGATTDDLTVATARLEPELGDSVTITALRVDGAQASWFKEPAVPLLLGIERPEWAPDYVDPSFRSVLVSDRTIPGSETSWIRTPFGDTLWLVSGADDDLLATIIEALPEPGGGRLEVPALGVAVTFPKDWDVDVFPLASESRGPETLAWRIASGEPLGGGLLAGSCDLTLYRPTEFPPDELMRWQIPEGEISQLGQRDDGLDGYQFIWGNEMGEMAVYGIGSDDAVAVLVCYSEGGTPEEHWRSIVDSIELSPVDEDQWRSLLEPAAT